jgi:hypothetical protein
VSSTPCMVEPPPMPAIETGSTCGSRIFHSTHTCTPNCCL